MVVKVSSEAKLAALQVGGIMMRERHFTASYSMIHIPN